MFSHRANSLLVIVCPLGNLLSAEFRLHQKVCFVLLKKPILMQCHFLKDKCYLEMILVMTPTDHKHTVTAFRGTVTSNSTEAFNH